jgi:hypothetical protein
VVTDERLDYDSREAYAEAHMRDWRRAVHVRKREGQAGDLGVVDARCVESYLSPNKDSARAYYQDKYTEARELERAKENHKAIVASSSSRP